MEGLVVDQARHAVRYQDVAEPVFADIRPVRQYGPQRADDELVPADRPQARLVQPIADPFQRYPFGVFLEYAPHDRGGIFVDLVLLIRLALEAEDYLAVV